MLRHLNFLIYPVRPAILMKNTSSLLVARALASRLGGLHCGIATLLPEDRDIKAVLLKGCVREWSYGTDNAQLAVI